MGGNPAPKGAQTGPRSAGQDLALRAQQERAAKRVMREQAYASGAAYTSGREPRRRRGGGTVDLGYPVNVPGAIERTYSALGSTDAGREFALVNLHPCGEYVTECCGIPDESQVVSVTPTFRGDKTIALDRNFFETPPTLPDNYRYDIQLVVLPIPEIDFIYRVRIPSLNTGWSRWVVERTSYFAENADGTATTLSDSGYSSTRLVGRGITVHFDAPELANQGRLIAGQIKAPSSSRIVQPVAIDSVESTQQPATVTEDTRDVNLYTFYVPQDETELTTQDPYAAQWEAKFGTYIPHRYVDPVQLFSDVNSGKTTTISGVYYDETAAASANFDFQHPLSLVQMANTPDLLNPQAIYHETTPTWGAFVGGNNEEVFAPLSRGYAATWGVSAPLNQYTSVQFFLGIQNTAQLHVKTRLHLENQVHAMQSPVTPFVHRSPTYDPEAMRVIAYVSQNQAHVFFASDNDLSSILASIGKVLPGLLQQLSGSGVPFLSTVGHLGGLIGRGLGQLTRNF